MQEIIIYPKPYFEGLNAYAKNTYDCNDYIGCLYNQRGRCIYHIAPIKQEPARGCYRDMIEADTIAMLDYC